MTPSAEYLTREAEMTRIREQLVEEEKLDPELYHEEGAEEEEEEVAEDFTGRHVFRDGREIWYLHGNFHREGDLPAVVDPNGS